MGVTAVNIQIDRLACFKSAAGALMRRLLDSHQLIHDPSSTLELKLQPSDFVMKLILPDTIPTNLDICYVDIDRTLFYKQSAAFLLNKTVELIPEAVTRLKTIKKQNPDVIFKAMTRRKHCPENSALLSTIQALLQTEGITFVVTDNSYTNYDPNKTTGNLLKGVFIIQDMQRKACRTGHLMDDLEPECAFFECPEVRQYCKTLGLNLTSTLVKPKLVFSPQGKSKITALTDAPANTSSARL